MRSPTNDTCRRGYSLVVLAGGAALGPILAGLLFSLDVSLPWVAFAMALGSLIGAGLLIPLRPRPA